MHLADLTSYVQAQERLGELYADSGGWGEEGHFECRRLRKIFERSNNLGVRNRHLGSEAMPGLVETHPGASLSPLAGKPAPKEMLVGLARLEREYFERRPDMQDPNQMVIFGTSGHRGSPSVFISRWDTAVVGKVPDQLLNRLGIAIAKRTFKAYRDLLNSDRWQRAYNFGARPP